MCYEMHAEQLEWKKPSKSGFLKLYIVKAKIHVENVAELFG
jgi:hypothetical protein